MTYRTRAAIPQAQPRFRVFMALSQVHGIGPTNANRLYSSGVTNVEDLRARVARDGRKAYGLHEIVVTSLKHHDDLQLKIPREEVFRIGEAVRVCVQKLASGAEVL